MTFECPLCDHVLVKSGSWFQVVHGFTCEGCKAEIRLAYSDKVALFEKYAHLG
jgi:transcription initiation factor IIE alpha subunit